MKDISTLKKYLADQSRLNHTKYVDIRNKEYLGKMEAFQEVSEYVKDMKDVTRELLLMVCKHGESIIDDVSCKHCPRKGTCDIDAGECPQTHEEAVDLFIRYGLEES